MDRRNVLRLAAVTGAVAAGVAPATAGAAAKKPGNPAVRDILYSRWTATTFGTGTAAGTAVASGALTIASPVGQTVYNGMTYDYATWTSPEVPLTFAATEAISSWTAQTPGNTWVQVELRGWTAAGTTTKWYVLGRWAATDQFIRRTSVPAQGDVDGSVAIDTFVAAAGHGLNRYQLRLTLYRAAGSGLTPQVSSLGAVAS